jgi:hypothetical protein
MRRGGGGRKRNASRCDQQVVNSPFPLIACIYNADCRIHMSFCIVGRMELVQTVMCCCCAQLCKPNAISSHSSALTLCCAFRPEGVLFRLKPPQGQNFWRADPTFVRERQRTIDCCIVGADFVWLPLCQKNQAFVDRRVEFHRRNLTFSSK